MKYDVQISDTDPLTDPDPLLLKFMYLNRANMLRFIKVSLKQGFYVMVYKSDGDACRECSAVSDKDIPLNKQPKQPV